MRAASKSDEGKALIASSSEWHLARRRHESSASSKPGPHSRRQMRAQACSSRPGSRNRRTGCAIWSSSEEGPISFGAYVPDLPGCIAAAETRQEALALIREAIAFHLQGLKKTASPSRTRRPRPKSSKSNPPEAGMLSLLADRPEWSAPRSSAVDRFNGHSRRAAPPPVGCNRRTTPGLSGSGKSIHLKAPHAASVSLGDALQRPILERSVRTRQS